MQKTKQTNKKNTKKTCIVSVDLLIT